MILDNDTLIKRLRYQGRQYESGKSARGGNPAPHMLTQAANRISELEDAMKLFIMRVNKTKSKQDLLIAEATAITRFKELLKDKRG